MTASFLWYDLETFGRDPRRARIAQFAAIRTDLDLQPIGEPISLFCQPADDLLPSPEATLITRITPQQAQRDGLREAEFFSRLQDELSQPGTCAVGYNSLRFDDEFVRFGLYRNFHDAYERELRPEGLAWPLREDGAPSFRLEDLARANGTREGEAHEALSDVRALLGIARKVRAAQPRLWEYLLKLRDKRHCGGLLDPAAGEPLLHISGRYPAARHCAALVLPLARHPRIDSRVIACDLDADPSALLALSPDEIADRLYTPAADLPEGEARIPLKEIHSNRCPVLVPIGHLREEDFERLGIDRAACEAHAERLRTAPGLAEKVRRVFASESARTPADADAALYDAFIGDADKRLFARVRSSAAGELAGLEAQFRDPRLPELLFRYRARNWPGFLVPAERERWNRFRRERLGAGDTARSEYSFASQAAEIAVLRAERAGDDRARSLLDALEAWSSDLARGLG